MSMGIFLGVEMARPYFVDDDTKHGSDSLIQPAVKVPQRCAECGRRSTVIVDPRTDSKQIFFIQRSRCCDHNE